MQFGHRRFDFGAEHVEAAGDDHVLLAVDDVIEPVGIAPTDIAGVVPAMRPCFGGDLGQFEIAAADDPAAPDDLAKLQGVGPQIVKKLNDAGIFHYWQIAAMTAEDMAKIDRDLKLNGRIERDGWINQARSLIAA